MVLGSLGLDVPESQLRAACDSTIIGTDALKAVDAARQLGFTGSAKYTLSLDELLAVVADDRFPIVFISLLPIDANPDIHAVVVIECAAQGVVILDPLQGERQIPLPIFQAAWTIGCNLAILIER
jgi:ABC-type bacteriocin/lantibiotic exporter with double-glycine peptidase domain